MSLNRRQILSGAGFTAAVSLAGGVSACSPPVDFLSEPIAQNLFGKIASRKLDEAKALLDETAFLTIITSKNSQTYKGREDVVGKLSELLHSGGFRMIGDNKEYAPGGYWGMFGGWHVSDMLQGNKVELNWDNCGLGSTMLSHSVLNVYLQERNSLTSQIVIMESRDLSYNRDLESIPIEKGAQ